MDPLLAALGIEVTAATAVDTAKFVTARLREWARGDEVTRLFAELEERFGEIPGVSMVALNALRDDERFLRLLAVYFLTGEFPRKEFVERLAEYLGPVDGVDLDDLAADVADAIQVYGPRARRSERELFAIESLRRELRELIGQQSTRPRTRRFTVDWAPPLSRDRVQRLMEIAPEAAAIVQDALAAGADIRAALRGAVLDPQPWLVEAPYEAWALLGEIADSLALWDVAAAAFEAAAGRPLADRAACLARVAIAYDLAGQEERYAEFIDRARLHDANHPQVTLASLRRAATPEERLALLDAAPAPDDPPKRAALEAARAVAHLEAGDLDAAEAATERVQQLDPDARALRELRPMLALGRGRDRTQSGLAPDVPALRAAATQLLDLRADLLESNRYEESGRVLAQAVNCLLLAGARTRAIELLESVSAEERAASDAAYDLADAALTAQRVDLAQDLLPQGAGETDRLARAQLGVLRDDIVEDPARTLEDLLDSSDEFVRVQAALTLGVAAIDDAVSWPSRARDILEAADPVLAALISAERHARSDDVATAEEILLPHADHPRVLRTLIRWAGAREDWDRVLDLSGALLRRDPLASDRVIHADALRRVGRDRDALQELAVLRADEAAPDDDRADAFALSTQIAAEANDFALLERISRDWFEFDRNPSAGWRRVYAFVRLAQAEGAIAFVDANDLVPRNVDEAELLAAALERARPGGGAVVNRLADLSDQFGQTEQLEALVVLAALQTHPDDRAEIRVDVSARIQTFTDRFPGSQIIRAEPIDDTPEGVQAFLETHVPRGADDRPRELERDVESGQAPVVALAAAAGRPAGFVWSRLRGFGGAPLGFANPELRRLERANAEEAVGRGVVWDVAALAIGSSLPADLRARIRNAFPGSILPQVVLEDAARAAQHPGAERDEYIELTRDRATGEPRIVEYPPEEVERERAALAAALELARGIDPVADVDRSRPTSFDDFLEAPRGEPRDEAFATWPASLSVAVRERRPLYSDDRVIRIQARQLGVPTFGTLDLLDVLLARGLVTAAQRDAALRDFVERGALGVPIDVAQLIADASSADWRLTRFVGRALLDPAAWTGDVGGQFKKAGELLESVFEADPDNLDVWVMRVLDAAVQALPNASFGRAAENLLLVAWIPFSPERRQFVRALMRALRDVRTRLIWYQDPVAAVTRRAWELMTQGEPRSVRALVTRALLEDLDFGDQLSLLGATLGRKI